jgi:hypothetical protein
VSWPYVVNHEGTAAPAPRRPRPAPRTPR